MALKLPPDQMLQRAIQALANGQLPFAEEACRSVLKVQPQRGDAWLWLARAVMEGSRLEEVDELLKTAERHGAPLVEVLQSRSSLRWRQGRDQECLDLGREILSMRPGDVETQLRMAGCERRLGNPADSLRRLAPFQQQPVAATLAAWAHLDLNDHKAAIAAVLPHTNHPGLNPVQRSNLHHVLGFAYEGLGEYETALQHYTRSKDAIPIRLDETAFRRNFRELQEVFSADYLAKAPRPTVRTERPVFVAAMPRSGTTLLDRIIASHPSGAGAGETRALRGQVAEWNGTTPETSWPRIARTLTTSDLDRIVVRYLKETDVFGASALRIADKHLMNWLSVGLIAMAFPDARVIHIRRDPLDAGISCFERLRAPSIGWSSSLRTIGIALKACETLMEHWKRATSLAILTVDYESLVRDQERETRRIIEFLGLPWDDACLTYHRGGRTGRATDGTAPPPTLASEQAAKPMYDSSIGRGARFGASLDPLRQAYAEAL